MAVSASIAELSVSLIVLAAIAIVALMAARTGAKGITTFVAGYFLLFAFGPVVNYLIGNEIYSGITLSSIPAATLGIFIALVGMCVAVFLVPQRPAFNRIRLTASERTYPAITVLHLALSAYAIYSIATLGSGILESDKLTKVSAVGPYHYDYLLVAMLASAFFFTAMRTKHGKNIFWLHLTVYSAYCLVMDERDFIFVYVSLFLHSQLFRDKVKIWIPLLAGGGLLALATYLFAQRSGESANTAQALNQGSLLFVDSYIVARYPDFIPFQWGGTYLDAVTGIAPNWLIPPKPALADQLVQSYAPGSTSGYGFSLSAEAYINFGLVGILIVFFGLAVAQQALINRCDKSLFWAYASIAFTVAWMYAMRGESVYLIKVCVDSLLLYAAVSVTAWRPTRTILSRPLFGYRSRLGESMWHAN